MFRGVVMFLDVNCTWKWSDSVATSTNKSVIQIPGVSPKRMIMFLPERGLGTEPDVPGQTMRVGGDGSELKANKN